MRRKRLIVCTASGLALVALALASGAAPSVSIADETIRTHVTLLASEKYAGRRTGERGNEEAAHYIAAEFRRIGLKPIASSQQRRLNAKMNGSGYYQPWSFTAGSMRGPKNRLEASIGGRSTRYRAGVEYEPSATSGSGEVTADVVFAGYGVKSQLQERDDYAGVDVKGKVVLALAGNPAQEGPARSPQSEIARKAQTARDLGAGALMVAMAKDGALVHLGVDSRPSDAGIPVIWVRRSVAAAWLKSAGKVLADVEKTLKTTPQPLALPVKVTVAADVQKLLKPSANIVGLLPGSDPRLKDEVVVIGAHMDHLGRGGAGSLGQNRKPALHPGADDNASGTAGVLAIASSITSQPIRPKRSVVFICFSGEEQGLLGSNHYVKNPIVPLDRTAAMVNLDMIGRSSGNKLNAIGVGTAAIWGPMLDEINAAIGFTLAKTDSGFGGSDHMPFASAKVPVLFIFTGTHPDYHRPTDTADKINYWDAKRAAEMAAEVVVRVANAAEKPVYTQPQTGGRQGGGPRRPRASLGVVPDYAGETAGGVAISGVRSGTSAEKVGMKAGDLIVKIGDRSVRSMEDYMAALSDKRVGDSVQVVVKRGTETLTFTVTLVESRMGPSSGS